MSSAHDSLYPRDDFRMAGRDIVLFVDIGCQIVQLELAVRCVPDPLPWTHSDRLPAFEFPVQVVALALS
jgi:hypothetical protein